MTVPLSGHEAAGVRWRDGEPRLPRSYGDAAGEYDALRERAALVDRCDRALLRVFGRDPLRILQGMLSNDVTLAGPNRAVYGTLLTPKGKLVSELRVLKRAGDYLLELPVAALPGVAGVFRRSVPPLFARWEELAEEGHVLGVYGPEAGPALAGILGVDVSAAAGEDAAVDVSWGGAPVWLVGSGLTGGPGYDVIASRTTCEALWSLLLGAGVRPAGHAPLDVARIEAGVPAWGAELTEEVIPLEAGLQARAISTSKGCYTGQEVIVRILHRGHVNRLLRGVLLGGAAGATAGTPLLEPGSGREVGRITSSAWSPRLDQEVALAYLRRELEPGTMLELAPGGPAVQVAALPFAA